MACSDNNFNAMLHCKISASKTPKGNTCSGQLLFEDNFDIFDPERWHHEVSASGGRVVPIFYMFYKFTIVCFSLRYLKIWDLMW
jgi:hypothetical protein